MGSLEILRAGDYPKYPKETVLLPVHTTRQRNFALYVTGVIFTCKYFQFGLKPVVWRCVICTVLHFLHWCITHLALVLHILHSFLSQSELSNFFVYIIMWVINNRSMQLHVVFLKKLEWLCAPLEDGVMCTSCINLYNLYKVTLLIFGKALIWDFTYFRCTPWV